MRSTLALLLLALSLGRGAEKTAPTPASVKLRPSAYMLPSLSTLTSLKLPSRDPLDETAEVANTPATRKGRLRATVRRMFNVRPSPCVSRWLYVVTAVNPILSVGANSYNARLTIPGTLPLKKAPEVPARAYSFLLYTQCDLNLRRLRPRRHSGTVRLHARATTSFLTCRARAPQLLCEADAARALLDWRVPARAPARHT